MADNVATEFLSNMKARGRKAMDWLRKLLLKLNVPWFLQEQVEKKY